MNLISDTKEEPNVTLPKTDAERWIAGTYAIWSEYCGGSYKYLGGYEKTKASAKMIAKVLEEDWMVDDHKSGVETVEYLLENAGLDVDEYEDYDEDDEYEDDEDFDEDDEYDDEDYDDEDDVDDYDEEDDDDEDGYEEDDDDEDGYEDDDDDYDEDDDEYDDDYDEVDTIAFDYACACNLCGRMFIAGFMTREESIRYATEAAKKIQERYDSWKEYFEAYIIGAAGGFNVSERKPFEEAYEKFRNASDSPMHLDWNMEL